MRSVPPLGLWGADFPTPHLAPFDNVPCGTLVLVSDRYCRQVCSRPGPASVPSARGPSCDSPRTDGFVPRSSALLTQQGGVAVSRLDGCGISLRRVLGTRLPDPFLGSPALPRPLPAAWGELGPALRGSEDSLLAVRSATGGDVNPTCRWALSRPLVPGGLGSRRATLLRATRCGLRTSLAADFRPARGSPDVTSLPS
jgi:hypothetical protein